MTAAQPPHTSYRLHTLLALTLLLLVQTVSAGPYTLRTPTAATRWTAGQPGALITIVSTDKAKASTGTNSRLLTVTLRRAKGGLFGGSDQVAAIADNFNLLVPADVPPTQTEVVKEIQWTVPANLEAGNKYFVLVSRVKEGLFDFGDKAESPEFFIGAPAPGTNTTTGLPTPPPATATVTGPTSTAPAPTAAPTPSCEDIQQQCAAQARTYIPPTSDNPACSCGDPLPAPKVHFGMGVQSVPLPRKTSSGAMAALIVIVMVLMGMF